jgi:hypothetical protein
MTTIEITEAVRALDMDVVRADVARANQEAEVVR